MTTTASGKPSRYLSARVYTKLLLANIYQNYVLGFSFNHVCKCPTFSILLPFFAENFSPKHLGCGVGDGYFSASALRRLDRQAHKDYCVTLLDINTNCLDTVKGAILSGAPKAQVDCLVADMTQSLPIFPDTLQSIAIFNSFHCLAGASSKYHVIGGLKQALAADGVLFGCTILGRTHAPGWLARVHLAVYNWVGVFNNMDYGREEVEKELSTEFNGVETWVVEGALLFKAKKPK